MARKLSRFNLKGKFRTCIKRCNYGLKGGRECKTRKSVIKDGKFTINQRKNNKKI